MKTLILATILAISFIGVSFANEVHDAEGHGGKGIIINVYPKTFATKAEAQAVANGLENADVYQDQDTKQYQVIYGNYKIHDVFVVSSMEEK